MNNESMNFRLVISNIPKNFSESQLTDLLNKNFANSLSEINIIKLGHKYNKNNKVCFISAKSFEIRKNVMEFFATFELVDSKGYKTKLSVLDCLQQVRGFQDIDPVEKTIDNGIYVLTHSQPFSKIQGALGEGQTSRF
jgi:RNA recognition motif-containing protein